MSFLDEIKRDKARGSVKDIGRTCTVAGTSVTYTRSSLMSGTVLEVGGMAVTVECTLFVLTAAFGTAPASGKAVVLDGSTYRIANVTKTPSGASYQITIFDPNK